MALFLEDESKVLEAVLSNPPLTPIIEAKGMGYLWVNPSDTPYIEYKRVLTAANSDYLSVGSYNVSTLNDVDFEIDFIANLGAVGGVIQIGKFLTSRVGAFSIIMTTTDIVIGLLNEGGAFIFNHSIPTVIGTRYDIKVKDSLIYIDGILTYDETANANELINAVSKPYFIGRYHGSSAWLYGNTEALSVSLEGKKITLNEPSGAAFTSTDGTITGTCETSAADPVNYINNTMIQPI